ncbi:MAG: hypothetical protein J6B44_06145 [Muribaculaceae bacterium]|nr:hypothetical protein [Muribaculaceae bacterium]
MSRLEAVVAEIEQQMAQGDCSQEILQRHQAASKELENAMSVWELAVMDYDEICERYKK